MGAAKKTKAMKRTGLTVRVDLDRWAVSVYVDGDLPPRELRARAYEVAAAMARAGVFAHRTEYGWVDVELTEAEAPADVAERVMACLEELEAEWAVNS